MIEVEIKDFQAIDRLKFRIEGFTAVVGRSNIGKSSIIRALKAALSGAEGNDFVRHNPEVCARVLRGVKKCQCQCSVEFKFADGRRLLWEKGDAINQYKAWSAEGVETVYSNVGGKGTDAPAMLESGFTPVELGQRKGLLQVADQFDPIFLLNLSGPSVADVLSDVAQLDDINYAMREVTRDRKSAASTRKVREEDRKTLEGRFEKYEGLDQKTAEARQVNLSFQVLQAHEVEVGKVSQYLADYIRTGLALTALQRALEPSLPGIEPLNASAIRYNDADRMLHELEDGVREIRSLMGVQKVEVPDVQPVRAKAGQLRVVTELHKRLATVAYSIRDLRDVDNVTVPALPALKDKVASLQSVAGWQERLSALETVLGHYDGFESVSLDGMDPSKLRTLKGKVSQARDFYTRLQSLETLISQTEDSLAEAESEEAAVLAEFEALGVCPTCSQDIRPGGHAHG